MTGEAAVGPALPLERLETVEIPNIDKLLIADEANVQTMRQLFADVSQELPRLLNEASVLYESCSRAFGHGLSKHARALHDSDEAITQLFRTKVERGLLLARIGGLYGMAVANFLRMQISAPLGNVRLQCESLALMKLFGQDPASAQKWREIDSDEQGRRFYRKYQGHIKSIL